MANNMNFTPEQLALMLQIVGKKLGTDPSTLKSMIEQGDIDGITGNLGGPMNKKLGEALHNPQQIQQMIQNADITKMLHHLNP